MIDEALTDELCNLLKAQTPRKKTRRRSRAEKATRDQGWDDCPAKLSNDAPAQWGDGELTHNPFDVLKARK